jgi:hypothetical protein
MARAIRADHGAPKEPRISLKLTRAATTSLILAGIGLETRGLDARKRTGFVLVGRVA